jgi:hypothetical protein
MLVIALAGESHDGGTAMGAFFEIGPFGGIAGFVAGVFLFLKIGLVRRRDPDADAAPARSRISRPFAAIIVLIAACLSWWGWYEFIRSPYLSHGYMALDLEFRLPPGVALPADTRKVHVDVTDGGGTADASFSEGAWHGHDGNRAVILATASIMYKTRRRIVTLSLPGFPTQSWTLDLAGDPDPTRGYTPWTAPDGSPVRLIEMNFRLEGN